MATFLPNSDRDRVLDATDLIGLVGEHVALRPKGREHIGLCPFHDDRSPSFAVVSHKGTPFYKCFACGVGGNAIDFVMNFHKMSFIDALKLLAARAGIELTQRSEREHRDGEIGKDDLYRANLLALKLYRRLLNDPVEGAVAREVVAKRRIAPAMVEAFQLGYAPDRRHVPFPSHACLSVNECVVHGTRGYYPHVMKAGDVLKVDIGVFFKGWVGDAAWTYSFGSPSPLIRRLMDSGKESLRRGCEMLGPKNTWVDWARAVQGHVEGECGFHLIRGLGGHGIGFKQLHGTPFVSNVVPTHANEWREAFEPCAVGTLVAVEPMISVGTGRTRTDMIGKKHDWPVYTADGSMSVHYEHDVLVTAEGPRILTAGLELVDDVVLA